MPHVLCVVHVGDGEVQGEEQQGRTSGCHGGEREIGSAGNSKDQVPGALAVGHRYSHGLQELKERTLRNSQDVGNLHSFIQ